MPTVALGNLTVSFKAETGDFDRASKRINSAYRRQASEAKRAGDAGTAAARRTEQAFSSAFAAVSGYAFGRLGRIADDFAERMQSVTVIEHAFGNLTASAELLGDTLVNKVIKASRGLVTEFDAMKAANRALLFGLPITEQGMADLTRQAIIMGRAMDLDAGLALDRLILGIGRKSRRILDDLGIIISATDAYENYAAKIGKATDELTAQEQVLAFTEETLRIVNRGVAAAGDLQVTWNDRLKVLKNRIFDAASEYSEFLAIMSKGGGVVFGTIEQLAYLRLAFAGLTLGAVRGALASVWGWFARIAAFRFVGLTGAWLGVGAVLERVVRHLFGINEQLDAVREAAKKATDEINRMSLAQARTAEVTIGNEIREIGFRIARTQGPLRAPLVAQLQDAQRRLAVVQARVAEIIAEGGDEVGEAFKYGAEQIAANALRWKDALAYADLIIGARTPEAPTTFSAEDIAANQQRWADSLAYADQIIEADTQARRESLAQQIVEENERVRMAQQLQDATWGLVTSMVDGSRSIGDAVKRLVGVLAKTVFDKATEGFFKALVSKLPGFASGGTLPGGLAVVGERGPEIVAGRGQVYSNQMLREALRGREASVYNLTINIPGRGLSDEALARKIASRIKNEIRTPRSDFRAAAQGYS